MGLEKNEAWIVLPGYGEGFRAFTFEKNGKWFRSPRPNMSIGLEVENETIFRTKEEYELKLESIRTRKFLETHSLSFYDKFYEPKFAPKQTVQEFYHEVLI